MKLTQALIGGVALVFLLAGCASTPASNQQLSPTAKVAHQYRSETVEGLIRQTVEGCRYIQRSTYPIECRFGEIEGKPAMYVGFSDVSSATRYIDVILDHLGVPYCSAAESTGENAFLVLDVRKSQVVNVYSCLNGKFSDWYSYRES